MEIPVTAPLTTRALGVVDSYRTARRNILEIIPELALTLPMISGRTGPQRWHMLMQPAGIRHVLLEAVGDYPKSEATKSILRPAIGNSMFIAEGAEWRWQRRAAAPAFSRRNVEGLAPVMSRAAEAAAARIAAVPRGRAFDATSEMVAATLDVIADVTFGTSGAIDRDSVTASLDAYIDQAARVSVLDVIGMPDWVPRPGRRQAVRTLEDMQASADAAIARRAEEGRRDPPDLLDLLMAAEDPETGRAIDAETLRENLLTFIAAGHETTALTLAWALYLLTFDPEVQERAGEEAQAALGDRAATVEDLPALPYCRRVIEETLRLYPPGGFLSRTAKAADRIAGAEIRPGDTVMVPVYAVHRHRLLWEEPDAFRPDRFETRPDRFSYLPFSDGPRICIGASLAMQEAVIILSTILARFRFTAVRGRSPVPVMILTLRPEGGVWLTAEPR
ncbi:cytochrome P450 [Rhodobacterales bacterium HKCCE3408]|nr:cytochrome P450 [Rhodobacterales bacterium HKCCE3408]